MPRIRSLDPAQRSLDRIEDFIRRQMRVNHIRHQDMAEELGISQQAFSYKLSKGTLHAKELIRIFMKLGTSKEEIGELMQ